ncbi:MAG: isoprenylcysteine carboxyl methyltransferase family protein [bacterium]
MKPDWLFYVLIGLLVSERAIELAIAHKNEKWILSRGGKEYSAGFSKIIVLFHISWFLAFAVEGTVQKAEALAPFFFILFAFLILQGGRYWCIASLAKFWNTKVLVLPDAKLFQKGPYLWIKHPNYFVVVIEIFLYPALFGCWWTAFVGSFVNGVLLHKRIRQEEEALQRHTNYGKLFRRL